MQLRLWVYRRDLSNNPQSPFRSNSELMRKAGGYLSGVLGFVFLCLALLCLLSPQADKDGKLFLIFSGLFGIFEIICIIYSCIPCCQTYCRNSDGTEEEGSSRSSLLSSEANSYQEVPGHNGIASYQASASYPEAPSYQAWTGYPEFPSYEAGSCYREGSYYQPLPYGAKVGNFPSLACLRPLANYEGVFAHQQIPIYCQDLIEPQLPPYSPGPIQSSTTQQSEILVY